MKIYDSELKVLNVLWDNGQMKAADIAKCLNTEIGWNKNTTYTVIKRCVEKKLVTRMDPGYLCNAAISKRKAANSEIRMILENYFDGSIVRFFLTLLDMRPLSKSEAKEMKRMLKNRGP